VRRRTRPLNVVDRNLLAGGGAVGLVLGVAVLVELEAAVAVLVAAEGVGLVDLGRVGELAVGFPRGGLVRVEKGGEYAGWCVQRTGLVGVVLEDHVALLVLVLAQ
jgi:hypothetical protein